MKTSLLLTICFLLGNFFTLDAQNFEWAKQVGGSDNEETNAITTDALGNVYVIGHFGGTSDFDPSSGVSNLTSLGLFDVFVCKLDASGNLLWVKQFGGTGSLEGFDIEVDASGNVYTTGYFEGTSDFDPGVANLNLASGGANDIFITKLNASGDLLWAKSLGSTSYDEGNKLALDASGNICISGGFVGTVDFDPGINSYNLTSNGTRDIFMLRLDPSGNFISAFSVGSGTDDYLGDLSTDASGNTYLTGSYRFTVDFDPSAGVSNLSAVGAYDMFVCKYNSSDSLIWAKNLGGVESGYTLEIQVDASNNVFVTGHFDGTFDFDPGVDTMELTVITAFKSDVFLLKLDSQGNFKWVSQIGGTDFAQNIGLDLDSQGNLYVLGIFRGTIDFDPGAAIVNVTSNGNWDIFISKLDTAGAFLSVYTMGGIQADLSKGIHIDASNNIYSTGYFHDVVDFDPGVAVNNLTATATSRDIYIHKMGQFSSGIYAESPINKIGIFPNPTNSQLHIQSELFIEQAQIYSINGALLKTIQQPGKMLDVSDLQQGMYILLLATEAGPFQAKFIKE